MAVKKTKAAVKSTTTRKAKAPKSKVAQSLRCGGKSCSITGCKRAYRAKSYCGLHYREWRNGKFGHRRYKTCRDKTCRFPMAMNRHGFCEEHFQSYFVKGIEQAKEPAQANPTAKPETKPAVAAAG